MSLYAEPLSRGQFDEFPEGVPEIVEAFLQTKAHSPGAVRNVRSALRRFFEVVPKHPYQVKIGDWLMFAAALNASGALFDSKQTITSNIRSFFDYVDFLASRESVPFKNPVPKRIEYCGLTPDSPAIVRAKHDRPKKFIPDDKLRAILAAARGQSYAFYLMLLLLTNDGMRVVEMLTVKRQDIHLDQRWLETGFEAGARKSNKKGERRIVFYFPESVRLALKQYLNFAPASEWLFPGLSDGHKGYAALEKRIRRLAHNTGIPKFTSHWFRKTLNTNRKYKMKCPKEDRQKLLNHIIHDAIECYDEAEILTLRDVYDTYHPYKDLIL